MTERNAFYMHGAGPKGSDGCIVPASKNALKQLLAAIKTSQEVVTVLVHSDGVRGDKFKDVSGVA